MNYRHIYHAGNFADIFKHLVFRMVLDYVQQKEKGAFVLDAFAGVGLYDLSSDQAQRTLEYEGGIAAFMQTAFSNADLGAFQDLVRKDFSLKLYAGSPVLAANMLRPQDRLIANELHPEDLIDLRVNLKTYKNASVTHQDAYEVIRANIPPKERRGIILVDPPFEKKDEFQLLVQQMAEWKKRWETGCDILWYPIKANALTQVDDLYAEAAALKINRTWVSEFMIRDRETPEGLNGCGLLIFNTPFQIPERVEALTPELTGSLGGSVRSFYL